MTAARLLAELRELDVHVMLDGDRLRLNAPAGTLTEEHKRELADRKPEVIAFLQAAQQLSTQPRAIVPLQASGSRTPIFAVAGHNGDVFAYRALAGHLGADQPFFGLQPRGLEQTEDPMTRVEDIAEYFASQIGEFRPDGAVTIAGYCAGGSIAYELARRLSNSGAEVSNLILFGAPHCSAYRRAKQSLIMAGHYTTRSVTHARALLTMPAAERSAYIAQRTARLSPPDASDPVMLRRSAVEDATVAAVRAYSPAPSPVHIDFMLPCEAWKRSLDDPLRWGAHAGSSEVFVGPSDCNGDTMLLPDHAGTFARFVAEAQRRHADS